MKKVLVNVDEVVWGKVRARALEEGVPVEVVVGRALRGELTWRGDGSVASVTGGEPPAAERGEALDLSGIPNDGLGRTSGPDDGYRGQPRERLSVEDLKRRLAPLGAAVGTGRELAEGTLPDPTDLAPPTRVENRQSVEDLSPRDAERRRRARQDHLRTHPEDDSQDPKVDF